MSYKYKEKIIELKETDGEECYVKYKEKDCEAFRWTFEDIKDKRNFVPTAFDQTNNGARRRCTGYCISFHETEQSSEDSWSYLISDKPKKIKKIGTHMAKGNLSSNLGKCSESDYNSHFNFVEYKDTDLSENFEVFRKLASEEILSLLK